MRYPTALGTSVAFSAMISLLVGATIGALVARQITGAYCIGFAVAGWMHFLMALTPWFFQRGMDRFFITVDMVERLAPVFGHKNFDWNLNSGESLIENALLNYYTPDSPADRWVSGELFMPPKHLRAMNCLKH